MNTENKKPARSEMDACRSYFLLVVICRIVTHLEGETRS